MCYLVIYYCYLLFSDLLFSYLFSYNEITGETINLFCDRIQSKFCNEGA